MTARTRWRVTIGVVMAVMTLPAEAMLFPVALTPDARTAATRWAQSLNAQALHSAALTINEYPPLYRRAIMGALDPAGRSDAWRARFDDYLASHPALSAEQIAVVQEARAVASPEAFAPPVSPDVQARIGAVFNAAIRTLGARDAGELFVTLGPTAPAKNALPLTQRLADEVRTWRVASAAYPDCNCNVEVDTCDLVPDPWLKCSEIYTCNFDLTWPMCGPLWSWACTGWCKIIRWPGEGDSQ